MTRLPRNGQPPGCRGHHRGASGIGLAFAARTPGMGAHVVIGESTESAMERARAHLSDAGATVDCVRLDLQDPPASVRPLRRGCLRVRIPGRVYA